MTDKLSQYYEKAFTTAGEGGSIYNPMTILERAGHERKGQLLADLPLPDLSELIVMDYGVGSWGFGCVFPELKGCKQAIGVDVSAYAVECSRRLSEADPELSGKKLQFITSNGYSIELADESVDVVFAGECIEHIEDTEGFLQEIWRVLKYGGIAIITTPNEKPYLYRRLGVKWAMGFEHVALMDADTVLDKLRKFFSVQITKGYCSTISPELDGLVQDEIFAAQVATLCENALHQASGLIIQVQKTHDIIPELSAVAHNIVESEFANGVPGHRDVSLFEDTYGRMAVGADCYLEIPVPPQAVRCQIVLWSHPWSGIARIASAYSNVEVDLYSHVSGCARISLEKSDLLETDVLMVVATGEKNRASKGTEVIFFRAVFSCSDNCKG